MSAYQLSVVAAALIFKADLPSVVDSRTNHGQTRQRQGGKGKAASLPRDDLPASLSKGMSRTHIMRYPVGVLRLHLDQFHLPATGNKAAITKRLFDHLQGSKPGESSSDSEAPLPHTTAGDSQEFTPAQQAALKRAFQTMLNQSTSTPR